MHETTAYTVVDDVASMACGVVDDVASMAGDVVIDVAGEHGLWCGG
jgi:hypothetical protein